MSAGVDADAPENTRVKCGSCTRQDDYRGMVKQADSGWVASKGYGCECVGLKQGEGAQCAAHRAQTDAAAPRRTLTAAAATAAAAVTRAGASAPG